MVEIRVTKSASVSGSVMPMLRSSCAVQVTRRSSVILASARIEYTCCIDMLVSQYSSNGSELCCEADDCEADAAATRLVVEMRAGAEMLGLPVLLVVVAMVEEAVIVAAVVVVVVEVISTGVDGA